MQIHIVPHQHFDLVWRRPVAWYAERRAQLYRQAIELLEQHEEFTFSFSQTLPLAEFLKTAPAMRATVAELIRQKRLEWIGGEWSIADVNLCSPGALVRNIEQGRNYLKDEFEYEVRVGAFEDAFGVSAQLPQLLALSGYEFYKAGRMPRYGAPEPSGAFRWEAKDGSCIRCLANSPDGLSWGWGNLDNPDEPAAGMRERRIRLEQELRAAVAGAERSGAAHALVTVMGEEHDILPDVVELVRELRAEYAEQGIELGFSTHEACCRSIGDWEAAPLYRADEDFSRIFTGCYTSRIDSKKMPRRLESELFAADCAKAAVPDSCRETLALLQFHDAICGCHIAENAEAMTRQYHEALAALPAGRRLPWKRLWRPFAAAETWRPASDTAWGRWEFRFDAEGRPEAAFYDGKPIPLPRLVAREEHGTLWTEEYSEKTAELSARETAAGMSCDGDEMQIRTGFADRNFRNYWPGFSRLRYTQTLRVRRNSPWMEVELDSDFLGNSTELAVRLALPGYRFEAGEAEIPFGTVARRGYNREITRSESFPALDFVTFGNYIWVNAGTPAHAFRDGGLENLVLRSPVKRWAPWFPVTPEESMWDNGARRYRFALCADAAAVAPGERHRIGTEFQLAAADVEYEASPLPEFAGMPENLVIAGRDAAGCWWLFECAGRETEWREAGLRFAPFQIRKEVLR